VHHAPGLVLLWGIGVALAFASFAYLLTRRRRGLAAAGSLAFAAFCLDGAYITATHDDRLGPIALGLLLVVGAAALWYLDGLRRLRAWLDTTTKP
jgi:hypothetical protein